jgi:beta-phosphoglucomutase
MKLNKRAILFDLDGTLTDSMHLHYSCWKEILDIHGVSLAKEDFFRLEGSNIYSLMSRLTQITDNESINSLIRAKDKIFSSKYKFNLYPGAIELLDYLQLAKLRLGLITASSRERLNSTMPPSFLEKFSCIVTSDDMAVGKPSPEVYMEGARRLDLHPDNITVIENAPLGVQSAVGAGMRCLVVGHTLPKSDFSENIVYFKSMKALFRGIGNELK